MASVLPGERELVERAKGDPAAFGELYEFYFDRIYAYVFYQLKDHPKTQDVVSEIFLKVLTNIGKFVWQDRPFSAWLYRIARNCVVDHIRANQKETGFATLDFLDPDERLPEEVVEKLAEAEMIRQLVARLPHEQQEVIQLRFNEGLKFKDIAVRQNKSEGAVKAIAMRALNRMRTQLAQEGVCWR